jgi:hypothetical protein
LLAAGVFFFNQYRFKTILADLPKSLLAIHGAIPDMLTLNPNLKPI